MPIPPVIAGIYDTATTILNTARFRLNDKLKSLVPTSGKILDETSSSTQQAFNTAYRRLQDSLWDSGARKSYSEILISNIPPVTNMDPASQCSINWFTFFDGTNFQIAPVLPSNLIKPLWMSDRPSASGASNPFAFPDVDMPNMREMVDGLQSSVKRQLNCQWEWRDDTIYFPGAIIAVDFRIRFLSYFADIVDVGTQRWFTQPIPIMRCLDPLAWFICAEFAAARAADGDSSTAMLAVATACKNEAMAATMLLANRDVNQREDVRRIPYGGGSRGQGGGYGRWGW